ncbi:hypothetical protein ACFTZB_31100 [Rhodococcus sp. NPDC057014]|uniref:hypothetical protein n=1 Tax=Rhodococcus sp. NPDC057014 TaxID=3346000 RepID=UPI0036401445
MNTYPGVLGGSARPDNALAEVESAALGAPFHGTFGLPDQPDRSFGLSCPCVGVRWWLVLAERGGQIGQERGQFGCEPVRCAARGVTVDRREDRGIDDESDSGAQDGLGQPLDEQRFCRGAGGD